MAQEIITPSRELNQVQGPSEIRTLLCGLHPHETSPAFQIVSFTLSLAVGLKKKKLLVVTFNFLKKQSTCTISSVKSSQKIKKIKRRFAVNYQPATISSTKLY